MSDGEVRRVSRQDIQLVQNLIERCLQLYMNQKEVVATLLEQAKIEPGFTELVWQKLEEENQEFFKAYRVRLVVKQQINIFNKLLEKQVELMSQMGPTGETSMSNSIGSHIPPIPQNSAGYNLALKPENMHPAIGSSIPSTFTNGGSSLHAAVGMSAHAGRMDAPPDMLSTQGSNMGLVQGINVGMIKTEGVYGGSSPFMFGSDGNVLETRPTITDGSVSSFNNMESSSQPPSGSLLDVDSSSFGYLGQIPIPRNFSLSDLTADYSQSSDIFEYPRQPFLDQGDDKRLGSISEGLRYAEFDSDQLNNTSGTT